MTYVVSGGVVKPYSFTPIYSVNYQTAIADVNNVVSLSKIPII